VARLPLLVKVNVERAAGEAVKLYSRNGLRHGKIGIS
jgi:hypothetical protein